MHGEPRCLLVAAACGDALAVLNAHECDGELTAGEEMTIGTK